MTDTVGKCSVQSKLIPTFKYSGYPMIATICTHVFTVTMDGSNMKVISVSNNGIHLHVSNVISDGYYIQCKYLG